MRTMAAAQPPPFHVTADYISGLSSPSRTNAQHNGSCTSPTLLRRHRRSSLSNPLAFVRSQKPPIGQVIGPADDASQKQQWIDYAELEALTNQEWQRHEPLGQIPELPHDGVAQHLPEFSPQTPSFQSTRSSRQSSNESWGSWGSTNWALSSATTQSSSYSGLTDQPLCESPHELPSESSRSFDHRQADLDLGYDCPIHAAPGGEAKCRYRPRSARSGLRNMNDVRDHVCSHGLVCNDCSSIFRRWTHFRAHRKRKDEQGTCPNNGDRQIQVSSNSSNKPIDLPPEVILKFFENKNAMQSEADQWVEGYKTLYPQWRISRMPSPFYTENAKATATRSDGSSRSERQKSGSSSSHGPQLSQSTSAQPFAEDIPAPFSSWLDTTQVHAVLDNSSGLNHPECSQDSTKLSTHQSHSSGLAENSDTWIWPQSMPDQAMPADYTFESILQDNALLGGNACQTYVTDAVHDGASVACKPVSPLGSNRHYQPHRGNSPGAFSQLKKLRIPVPHRFRRSANGFRPPVMQSVPSSAPTAQQSPTSMSRHSSFQSRGVLPAQPVPNLKRSRRTDSTSSRSPVSKKACGSVERANSLNKLRDLHSKLYVAERERDKLVDFVREFRQEVDKWDIEDDSAGEVQHLIDIFNIGLKRILHLL